MKISIIGGAGRVGTAIAYALINGVRAEEIVLVDIMKNQAQGEALDLGHAAVTLSPGTKITGTDDYSAIKGSDIVVFTAGRARKPGETREQLFGFNAKIARDASAKIKQYAPAAKVIVVTNPSTQIGKVVQETTGFPASQIIVMDNQLDTARLRYYISQETGMPVQSIKSRAKGEHGEDMDFEIKDNLTAEQAARAKRLTKEAGMSIIRLKGYTCWGVASQVAEEVKKLK
ncbi:MAG: malate dehydrogenase [Candidatus Aenigmatarchaeota archaeon]